MGVESVVHYHHVFSILFEFHGLRWGNFRVMVAVRGFLVGLWLWVSLGLGLAYWVRERVMYMDIEMKMVGGRDGL